jgi:hypothetical protein
MPTLVLFIYQILLPCYHPPKSFFKFLLFICAYNVWVIFPPSPHPLFFLYLLPLPPTSSIPGRNYFALISNFVEKRV